MININLLAKSALAIMAAGVFLSILGFITVGSVELLELAKYLGSFVLFAIIAVTAMINAPRIIHLFS